MSRAPHTRTTVIFSAERACTVPSSPPTIYSKTDYSLLIGSTKCRRRFLLTRNNHS